MFIHYDPATHIETIIFSPIIRFRGDKLIWIVPLPSEAKVESINSQFFQKLDDYVSPPIKIQVKHHLEVSSILWKFLKNYHTDTNTQPKPTDLLEPLPGKTVIARRTGKLTLSYVSSIDDFINTLKTEFKDQALYTATLEWVKTYKQQNFHWISITINTDKQEGNLQVDEQVILPPFKTTFLTNQPYVPLTTPIIEPSPNLRTSYKSHYYVAAQQRSDIVTLYKYFSSNETVFAAQISKEEWLQKILSPTPEIPIYQNLFLMEFLQAKPSITEIKYDGTILTATEQSSIKPKTEIRIHDQAILLPIEALMFIMAGVAIAIYQTYKKKHQTSSS